MLHALEFLHPIEDIPETITQTLCGQKWAAKANAVFYWSVVPYRAEWRYGIYAHRIALIDAGHVGQALYTACTGLGLGTCGLGAFQHEKCCDLFGLDGEEEYIIYTAPVGTNPRRGPDRRKRLLPVRGRRGTLNLKRKKAHGSDP